MMHGLIIGLAASAALLYEQAVVRLLHERFADERTSYILLSVADGRVIDSRWPDAEEAVPVGSLVKPFTALAYGEEHGFVYPERTCRGEADGCWLPRGHGRIGIVHAIAHSCNAYFDALAADVSFAQIAAIAGRFSIPAPPEHATAFAYTGRAGLWKASPLAIARAYAQLISDPQAATILTGMSQCARSGTARALGSGLAKTGTAPCTHGAHAPGDGFVLAFDRDDSPRYLLLVRLHGAPGSHAAVAAAPMLKALREGK